MRGEGSVDDVTAEGGVEDVTVEERCEGHEG